MLEKASIRLNNANRLPQVTSYAAHRNTRHRSDQLRQACEHSLAESRAEYLDMHLLRSPVNLLESLMIRNKWFSIIRLVLFASLLFGAGPALSQTATNHPPNIIFILVDD